MIDFSDELLSLVLPLQTITARARRDMFTMANHPHSIRFPLIRSKLHSVSSRRTVTLCNKLPRRYFTDICNLVPLLSSGTTNVYLARPHNVNFFIAHFSSLTAFPLKKTFILNGLVPCTVCTVTSRLSLFVY